MEESIFQLQFIYICVSFICNGECTLAQYPTGLQCAGSTVVFNCVREGTSLLWRVSLQSNPSVSSMPPVIFFSDSTVNQATTQTLAFNGQQYTATLLEQSPLLNSSLTITAVSAMDLIVQCSDDQLDVLMLPLNVSKVTGPPPSPVGLLYNIQQQSNETINVTLTWSQPMTDDSNAVEDYTITLISSQDSEVTSDSTAIQLSLSYNTNYSIQVKANNCIGSSIKTTLGPLLFVDCLPPSAVNGIVFEPYYSNTTEGARIYYSCGGHNRSITQCMSDGRWHPDPSAVTCHLVVCELPQHPVNGSIVHFNGTLEHSQAVYQCNDGLIPPGQHITECVRDETTGGGKWSPNPMNVICRLDSFNCSAPVPPKNGYVDLMLSTDMTIYYYGCNQGYVPTDVRTAVCVGQDTWSSLPQQLNCTENRDNSHQLSYGAAVSVTAVICFISGGVLGMLCLYIILRCKQSYAAKNGQHVESQPPIPVYEDIHTTSCDKPSIELSENIAYGQTKVH